jgi:Putative prokaryotic signal transducing protein
MSMLITVERFTNPWEAHAVRGLLESEGVPASLADEYQIWANWQMSHALGGVKLQVSPSHYPQALEVLTARRNGEFELALERELQIHRDACPNCSSPDIQFLRSPVFSIIAMMWLFVFNVIIPPPFSGTRCKLCKLRFNYWR